MATLVIDNINEDCIKSYEQISLAEKQHIKQLIETILKEQCRPKNLSFSERWKGQFKIADDSNDEKLVYLKQRYQL
jgi:hypothetical protein